MMYVRIAALLVLLLFLGPLATPAGPTYARLLVHDVGATLEGLLGGAAFLTWVLRRLAEAILLRASGRRLRAATRA